MQRSVIKMSDIARLAGVSKSTVSRALSDSPLVNLQTRQRIKSIARERGYKINLKARNFRLKETFTVSVVIPLIDHISDPFFLDMLGHIADAVSERGHELLLKKVGTTSSDWLADVVDTQRSDGVILIGQGSEHDRINAVAERFSPIVVWGAKLADQRYCTVGTDNRLGGLKAVRHLIELGRRRIGFIGDRDRPESELRYEGYCAALAEAGLTPDSRLEVPARLTGEIAYGATLDLIDRTTGLDAIFANSDVIAMGTIRALHERGLRVPEDVSVVGYDDVTLAACFTPALTTVRQNIREGGRLLVDRLFQILDGRRVSSMVLPTELVVRKSSRPDAT